MNEGEKNYRLTRREFLKAGLAAPLVSSVSPQSPQQKIHKRPFGRTGLEFPILGMGTSPLATRWAGSYGAKQMSKEERAALVRYAYERGVRYFDTARTYDDAEEILGIGLKSVIQNCFVATKVFVFDPHQVRASVEKSLQALGVDRVDAVQIHNCVTYEVGGVERGGFKLAMKIHAELLKLRDEGLFKYIGLTTHIAFETAYKLICTGGFDLALLAICYFPIGMDTLLSKRNLEFREKCIAKAHELGMAVVTMKTVSVFGRRSRYLVPNYDPTARAKLPAAAMRWALSDERISLLAVGMTSREEIDQNVAVLSSDLTLTDEDQKLLADFSSRLYQSPIIRSMRVV